MTESDIKLAIHEYLQIMQNQGKLVFNRLNSGDIIATYGERRARIKLCQEGTPDFIVHQSATEEGLIRSHSTFYIEVKHERGKPKLREAQERFRDMVEHQGIPVHIVQSVDEVIATIADSLV